MLRGELVLTLIEYASIFRPKFHRFLNTHLLPLSPLARVSFSRLLYRHQLRILLEDNPIIH